MALHPRTLRLASLIAFFALTICDPAYAVTDDDGGIQGDPKKMASDSADVRADVPNALDDPQLLDAANHRGIMPTVRLTPRRVDVIGLENSRQTLHGTWNYVNRLPESFDGTAGSIEAWDKLEVPGHPVLQGYEKMPEEIGGTPMGYHYAFDVPVDWEGTRVILRFEGVDGLSKIWINGQKAGENDIATLPSEYDVTELLNFGGGNDLTMTIEKSLVTLWSRRELGGINREVYLQALPVVNLARLHVDTELSPDHRNATVNVRVKIANQSDKTLNGAALRPRLRNAAGEIVPTALPEDQDVPLPALAPGQTLELKVPLNVTGPELWTAESPVLYEIECDLLVEQKSLMSATQRFGFRDIAVRGHDLLVNGSPVKLRGTNYHITYPGFGEIVSREKIEHDLKLFLDANINCIRSRPTPSIDYVELCDEMGMYTTIEAMVTLMIYAKGPEGDHGANPAIAGPLRHHMATMVESYYSNPSVITWGLGNECPYYDYFKVAAIGMHAADESRPLFFGSDARKGVGIPFMDINDDHYNRGLWTDEQPFAYLDMETVKVINEGQWDYPDDRPNIFTEWLHVHTNNWKEVAYDPGIDDIWGYYAKAHLDFMYETPHYTGGFQFKGAPYRGIGASERWRGIFDGDRRINDMHWHMKKSHSPIRIEDTHGQYESAAGVIRFEVENRHDFTNLSALSLDWKQGKASGQATADVAPHAKGQLEIKIDDPSSEPIELTVVAPNGLVIDRYTLTVGDPVEPEVAAVEGEWHVEETDDITVITRGGQRFVVSRTTGLIEFATLDGKTVINGSPTAAVVPTQQRNFKLQAKFTLVNQMADWQAEKVNIKAQDGTVQIVADGRYTLSAGRMTTTFDANGDVTVGAKLIWDGKPDLNVFFTGITFPIDPALDTLVWRRDALWSAYPDHHIGRAAGVAPATGAPELTSKRDNWNGEDTKTWPWSQDLTSGVTRDFRSTKYRLYEGGLVDDAGAGIQLIGHGTHHLQAVPAGDDLDGNTFVREIHGEATPGFHLTLMNFHNGGTEPHMTKSLRMPEETAKDGWTLETQATFRLVQP